MVKKQKTEKEKQEIAFGVQIACSNKKSDYIRNIINGRYYLARCNMIAKQLHETGIIEKIDDCPKSQEYMLAEYALMKMQAIMSMRNAHFAKQDLIKDFKLTEEDVSDLEEDYYNGKIVREDYGTEYKRKGKAEFTDK